MLQINKFIFTLFFFFLLVFLFNIDFTSIFFCTVFCLPKDPDSIIIQKSVVREVKQILPYVVEPIKDFVAVSGLFNATKLLHLRFKLNVIFAGFSMYKIVWTCQYVIDQSNRNRENNFPDKPVFTLYLINQPFSTNESSSISQKTSFAESSSNIEIPSIVENSGNYINSIIVNISNVQIIASWCAALLFIVIVTFTFLMLWVFGREYAEKFKLIMINYLKLNKIFLFYLK